MEQHFFVSKVKLIGLFIFMFAFLVFSIYLLFELFTSATGVEIAGLIIPGFMFLVFSWVTLFLGKRILNPDPVVTVSPHGITLYGNNNPGFIPWDELEGFLPYVYHNNRFLGLIVKEEEKYIDQLNGTGRRLATINQNMGFPAFNISINTLKNRDGFLEALTEYNAVFFIEEEDKESV